jgi:Fic-DOC domain mobile mystery protein B
MKRRADDGKTPLDDTSGLLVDASSREELNAVEFQNVSEATLKYLARRPSDRQAPFTYEWFLKVHHDMFGNVWKWAGEIRKSDKNVGIDKLRIREALKILEKDYHYWISSRMKTDELTARLHHRLVWIHPFENGNGRWARLITNIHRKKHGMPLIEWPEKPLLESSNLREKYLNALRDADNHHFEPLIQFHQFLLRKK